MVLIDWFDDRFVSTAFLCDCVVATMNVDNGGGGLAPVSSFPSDLDIYLSFLICCLILMCVILSSRV